MSISKWCSSVTGILASLILLVAADGAGWRNDGTGRFPDTKPPLRWSLDENICWKVELPGRSLGSPVVVGDRVFVTSDPSELICLASQDGSMLWRKSHEYTDVFGDAKGKAIEANLRAAEEIRRQRDELQRAGNEARKAGNTAKHEQLRQQADELDKRYRELTVYPPKPGGDTGNSTSTPVCDGRNVFSVFATGIVSSHTVAGQRNWITFIDGARSDHSASPLLVDGKLIVHLRDLVALDAETGEILWRVAANERHGSPVAARTGSHFVVITASGDVVNTNDGKRLAQRQFQLSHNSPIIEDSVIYSQEDGAIKAFQLPRDWADDNKLELHWETSSSRSNQLASPVYHDGLLYGVNERGILTVTDAKTGETVYRQRLDFDGGRVDASLCLAGNLLFVSNTRGSTLVIRPGREFEQVARNELEGFSSSLAFSGSRMYVRTAKSLYCVGQ